MIPTGPHYVYQLHDQHGACLYIGCSVAPAQRLVAHSKKPWGSQIDYSKLVIERYDGFFKGRDRETQLIRTLQPKFNGSGTDKFQPGIRLTPPSPLPAGFTTIRFEGRSLVHWGLPSQSRWLSGCGVGFFSTAIDLGPSVLVDCRRCLRAYSLPIGAAA